jgi:hypothetical protein
MSTDNNITLRYRHIEALCSLVDSHALIDCFLERFAITIYLQIIQVRHYRNISTATLVVSKLLWTRTQRVAGLKRE